MVPLRLIGLHQFISLKDQTHRAFRSYKHSSSLARSNFRLISLYQNLFYTTAFHSFLTVEVLSRCFWWLHRNCDAFFPSITSFLSSFLMRKKKKKKVYQIVSEITTSQLIFSLCGSICKSAYIYNTEGTDLFAFSHSV